MTTENCPDPELQALTALATADPPMAIERVALAISQYAADSRLHFLLGSLLAGAQRYEDGISEMARAVELEPGFVLARFQLGFLQLTCAKPAAAQATWLPLLALPDDEPFKLFAIGLGNLIRDEFAMTIERLEAGIALNKAHPLVSNDMQLILDEVRQLTASTVLPPSDAAEVTSATQLMFERYAVHDTSAYKH